MRFFISAIYGGCAREAFGLAGFYSNAPSGLLNLRTSITLISEVGVMVLTLNWS